MSAHSSETPTLPYSQAQTNFGSERYQDLLSCMDSISLEDLIMAVRRQSQVCARALIFLNTAFSLSFMPLFVSLCLIHCVPVCRKWQKGQGVHLNAWNHPISTLSFPFHLLQGFSRGSSAYRGVTSHPSGRWESRIGVPGSRHVYLGEMICSQGPSNVCVCVCVCACALWLW